MKRWTVLGLVVLFFLLGAAAQKPFTLEQILSAPFPENLTAAKKVNRVAWTFNQDGKRYVWVAEAPNFRARRLTSYLEDDGQEISGRSFSQDGNALVYTRGKGKNSAGQSPNPTSNPAGVEQSVWSVAWSGGEPQKVDVGHSPKISSRGMLAYRREGQIWIAPLDGSAKPNQLVVRGQNDSEEWSPDGSRLAFVSVRGDHSFIGVYDVAAKTVSFVAPTVDSDEDPVWSLDGKRIAFVRHPAESRDTPQGLFIAPDRPHPWAIWVGDIATAGAREIWHSSASPQGSFPYVADYTGVQDIAHPDADRGPSEFSVRQCFTLSAVWPLPSMTHRHVLNHILGGWQLNPIIALQSGRPFDVDCRLAWFQGCDFHRDSVQNDRPNRPANLQTAGWSNRQFVNGIFGSPAPPPGSDQAHSQAVEVFCPNGRVAFFVGTPCVPVGTDGNLSRNAFRGSAFKSVDLGLFKDVQVREGLKVQFRVEAFNLFNRVNLYNPIGRQSTVWPVDRCLPSASDPTGAEGCLLSRVSRLIGRAGARRSLPTTS